ncbi:MAG: TetR/AcrR family transcriptional regulator [Pirellulales bacterium]
MPADLQQAESASAVARHIASVAARLFAERGFDATSVRDIVEASSVTKPTLYYHFNSKQGLAEALLSRPLAALVEEMQRIVDTTSEPAARLGALLDAQFAFCRDDPDRARFAYAVFFGPNSSARWTELNEYGRALANFISSAVDALVQSGQVPADRAARCTTAARGMVTVYTLDLLYREGELPGDLGRTLVDDLLKGFAASEAPDVAPAQRRGELPR